MHRDLIIRVETLLRSCKFNDTRATLKKHANFILRMET